MEQANNLSEIDQKLLFEQAFYHCKNVFKKDELFLHHFLSEYLVQEGDLKLALGWATISLIKNKVNLDEEIKNKIIVKIIQELV